MNATVICPGARCGARLALLPHYIGRIEQGLYLCALDPLPPSRKVWLLTRRQHRKDPPISTVVEYLTRIFVDRRLTDVKAGRTASRNARPSSRIHMAFSMKLSRIIVGLAGGKLLRIGGSRVDHLGVYDYPVAIIIIF